jgi:hypothetical protein
LRKRKILSSLVIIFVILLVASPWLVRMIQRSFFSEDLLLFEEREATIPFSGNWAMLQGNSGVYLLRNSEIRFLHPQQEEEWAFGTETLVPVATAIGEHVFMMESSPRYLFRINELGHMLYQQPTSRSVDRMTSCIDSYLLLQHPLENRLMPFSILDPQGMVAGNILLTEGEVIGSTISGRHEKVLITILRPSGQTFESTLLTYDLQGVLQSSRSFTEQIIVDLMITADGGIILLTNENIARYNLMMEQQWEQPVDLFYLQSKSSDGSWVLAHRPEASPELSEMEGINTVLTHIETGSGNIQSYAVMEEVTILKVRDKRILTGYRQGFSLYRQTGELLAERALQGDPVHVFLLPEDRVAVQRQGQVNFYRLQTGS